MRKPDYISTNAGIQSQRRRIFAKFPVFFPVIRELGAETGSRCTGSSASQSRLLGAFPLLGKTADASGS